MATAISTIEGGTVQISDVLTCTICKEHNSSPLIQLNCFHVCHKSCLKRSLKNAKLGTKFGCSECENPNIIPTKGLEGLPEELLQHKRNEIAAIFSNSSPPCKICEEIEEENVSSNFCITCKMHLCSTDTKRHKLLADHTIVTNAEIQTEQYLPRVLSSKKALCIAHSTEDSAKILEFFCQQCQIPTCQVCCITDHRPHRIMSIQEASGKLKEELKSKATAVQNKKVQCEYVIDNLEKLLYDLDKNGELQIERCQKWGEEVKQAIDRIVNENVQHIEDASLIQRNEIMKIKEEKNYQNKQLKSTKDYMGIFLKFGSNPEILQKHKGFIENLQKCLQQEVRIDRNTNWFEVQLKDVKGIENNLKEMLNVETIVRKYQIEGHLQLRGCELESKWKTDAYWSDFTVEGENVIAVAGEKIEVYGMNGEKKEQIKCHGLQNPCGIDAVDKKLFVSDIDRNKREILVIDRKGNLERKISLPAQEHGLDKTMLGLAVDPIREDLYIVSCRTDTVYTCCKGQTQAQPFITTGLNNPWYLCVTLKQEIIVSNKASRKVCKYNSEGELVWEYSGEGLRCPAGVCVDPCGHVYVCGHLNSCIHYLSPEGKFLSFIDIGEKIKLPEVITFKDNKLIIHSQSTNKIIVIKCKYN